MKKEGNILAELKEISPWMAGLPSQDEPFMVPDGYFDQFPSQIMSAINHVAVSQELIKLAPNLDSINKKPVFTVPAGYFQHFAADLLRRLKASETEDVDEELELLSPLLGRFEKKTPFSMPENYFSELADNLNSGIQALSAVNDELENLSPLMIELKNKNPFEAPPAYFDNLAAQVLDRAKSSTEGAKVISFSSRKSWLKYAAAAALTGILITIGLFTFDKHSSAGMDPLAAINKVSDQEIAHYIETEDITLPDSSLISTASLEWNDIDVKDLLQDVPDAELQQFIN